MIVRIKESQQNLFCKAEVSIAQVERQTSSFIKATSLLPPCGEQLTCTHMNFSFSLLLLFVLFFFYVFRKPNSTIARAIFRMFLEDKKYKVKIKFTIELGTQVFFASPRVTYKCVGIYFLLLCIFYVSLYPFKWCKNTKK